MGSAPATCQSGSTNDKRSNSVPSLIGHKNVTTVVVNGVQCPALIDTGAEVTTVSKRLVYDHNIQDLDVALSVHGASGSVLPYIGVAEIEVNLSPDFSSDNLFRVLALVTPDDAYGSESVPLVIGTNLIKAYYLRNTNVDVHSSESTLEFVSEAWQMAFTAIELLDSFDGVLGTVKTTKAEIIPAGHRKAIHGLCRPKHNTHLKSTLALPESIPEHALPGGLLVSSSLMRVASLDVSTCRVSVEIQNHSLRDLTIPAKTSICNLHKVSMVNHSDPDTDSESSMLTNDDLLKLFNLPSGRSGELLSSLLDKWKEVFSLHDMDFGHTNAVTHDINLNDETPVKLRHRRLPPSMYEEVRDNIQEMLHAGHIRPSNSPWSFPVVLVRKKDNSLRFCVDYRILNSRTIRDAFPLPRIEETIDALSGARYFSSLDLRSGYWQVELKEEHKERTAFTAGPLGFYEFNSMPFGLTNAPTTFQKLMHRCLGDLHDDCLVYLDDIVVFSSSISEHIEKLEKVFQRLQQYNLKLKPSKCHFLKSELLYLGHVVSSRGVHTDPDKLTAVRTWPTPTNIKEVQQFIGFVGFYRRFIQNFAKISEPLHKLL